MIERQIPPRPAPHRGALFGVLAAVASVLATTSSGASPRWTYAASDHFEVYLTGGERRARDVLGYFERVHAFFADFLKLQPKIPRPTRLVVFSSAREYEPYRLNENASAYYVPGPDRDCIVMQSFDAEWYPVVVHEYTHLVVRHANAAYPVWLNEGLADFFSTLEPAAGHMHLGQVPLGRLREVRTGTLLDIDRLFNVRHWSTEYATRRHAGMFYAQSWALTHMILTSDGYRAKLDDFLGAMAAGTPSADALSRVYGKTGSDVFRDLRAHVQRDQFLFFKLPYKEPTTRATVAARPATAFEAELVLANLLAHHETRLHQARAAYERLAAERPDDRDLLEARGVFEAQQGNHQLAEPLLRQAVAAKSQNATVYRWATSFASSDEEREHLLQTAIALAPDDLDVRLAYASALKLRGDAHGARNALAPVTRVKAERAFMFYELQANISLQLREMDAARRAALNAKAHAAPGRESEYADRLLAMIGEHAERAVHELELAQADRPADTGVPPATAAPASPTPPQPTPRRSLTVAEGRLRRMICETPAVIEFQVADRLLRLAIDDPLKVTVRGVAAGTIGLACGPQDRAARIGYLPDAEESTKTSGILRLLEFR